MDGGRLRTLGRLILAKRLGKIAAVLPATCRCVNRHAPALMQAFATACPPSSLGRQDNARQFHDFILGHRGDPPAPGYLADLVRVEYAAAAATFAARDQPPAPPPAPLDPAWTAFEVRAPPDLRLLETEFDLQRAMVDSPPAELERGRRRQVAVVPGAGGARVFWLEAETAKLLLDLREWIRMKAPDQEDARWTVESLAARGLVELRPCASV